MYARQRHRDILVSAGIMLATLAFIAVVGAIGVVILRAG
jgi:hypothetical protein